MEHSVSRQTTINFKRWNDNLLVINLSGFRGQHTKIVALKHMRISKLSHISLQSGDINFLGLKPILDLYLKKILLHVICCSAVSLHKE